MAADHVEKRKKSLAGMYVSTHRITNNFVSKKEVTEY